MFCKCEYDTILSFSLKALDLEFLRALQNRVNIVPIIAKADTLTTQELTRFKQNVLILHLIFVPFIFFQILNDLKKYNIRLYEIPEEEPHAIYNGGAKEKNNVVVDIRSRIPFAVVGSTKVRDDQNRNRRLRVREYIWGTVEVDNIAHNDFIALRDMIIRQNMIDLINVTKSVHYENFRTRSLPKSAFDRSNLLLVLGF